MLIDCHTHAYTKEQIRELSYSMKKNQIDKSIIMYWPNIGGTKNPLFNVPPLNEVLENIKSYPNLFLVGSIRVTDEKNFNKQLVELEDALCKRRIIGIKLYLGYEHFFANDSRCEPICELCIKYDVPVVFHTGDTWKLKTAAIKFANPIHIDDVAIKFPRLKILISHLGNPCWIREVAELVYKNKNVFADFSGTLSFPSRFEKEYNENLRRQILDLVAYCGTPRKILFGSDFNIYRQEQYIEFLNSFKEFSVIDLEYIKHKNAENLFTI